MSSQYGFASTKKYKRQGGRVHILHVLRLKCKIKEKEGNSIKIYGNIDAIDRAFDEQKKMNEMRRRGRKTDVVYYEVMGYISDTEKIEQMRKYLSEKYNRDVVAVAHFDESRPHTHFIVPWVQGGQTLRLKKGDFFDDWKKTIRLAGRQYRTQGGRRMLSLREYMLLKNRGQAEQKIREEQEKARKREMERLEQLRQLQQKRQKNNAILQAFLSRRRKM